MKKGLVICILFWSLQGLAQQASAAFDSTWVETGDLIRLHVRLDGSANPPEGIDLSPWATYFPQENILGQTGWMQNGDSWENEIQLIYFDADTLQLPPITVSLNNRQFDTGPLTLLVGATPSPEEILDMADIKDIHREPAHWTDYMFWILLLGGMLLLAVLAYFISKYFKKKESIVVSRTITVPPQVIARRKLALLAQEQQPDEAAYYTALSYILREYLEGRYRFPALEWSREAVLARLDAEDFPHTLRPGLSQFISETDLIKFAQAQAPYDFKVEARQFVLQIIEVTEEELEG
jgi:hypothetical protein